MLFDMNRLIGTWSSYLYPDLVKKGVFRVLEDFRYISFLEDDSPDAKQRWLPIKNWSEFVDDSTIRFRPVKIHQGWIRKFCFRGETLFFETIDSDPIKKWECHRLKPNEIPSWFDEQVSKVLSKDWK